MELLAPTCQLQEVQLVGRGCLPYKLANQVRNAEVPTTVEWKGLQIATCVKMLESHDIDKP